MRAAAAGRARELWEAGMRPVGTGAGATESEAGGGWRWPVMGLSGENVRDGRSRGRGD